jgi:hypothetical protein
VGLAAAKRVIIGLERRLEMKHTQILKRAWKILWNYRVLWIFGFLLALTTASGGSGNAGSSGNSGYQFNGNNGKGFNFNLPPEVQTTVDSMGKFFNHVFVETHQWVWYLVGFIVLSLIIGTITSIIRYVSETSMIRMVDRYEDTEEKMSFKQGWRVGWSRSAWKLFLIDLVIVTPVVLATIVLIGCAFLPVTLSWVSNGQPALMGIVATIGMFFLFLFVAIVVSTVLNVLLEVIRRVCVMENQGVRASVKQGWRMFTRNWKDIGLMWLILLGIKIAFAIVTIPIVLILLGASLVAGILLGGLIVFALKSSLVLAIILGALVFIFVLSLVFGVPMTFVQGLLVTYLSSTWTLAYRDIKLRVPGEQLLEPVNPSQEPKADISPELPAAS